jgi:hypothetical protein
MPQAQAEVAAPLFKINSARDFPSSEKPHIIL